MNLEFSVDKNTRFYYWLQTISNWNPYLSGIKISVQHQNIPDQMSNKQRGALNRIADILKAANEPIGILSELYSNNINSVEAKEISAQSEQLAILFDPIWESSQQYLKEWLELLSSTDFTHLNESLKKISNFFESRINLNELFTVYLIHNKSDTQAAGHYISETNFILLRPPIGKSKSEFNSVIYTLLHEYIHAIEFKSTISRNMFKNSYEKYINANDIPAPEGYTWKSMYTEAIAHCFSSKTIGGYLGPEITNEPNSSFDDLKKRFSKVMSKEKYNTIDVINWAALNILSDVTKCIENKLPINQQIADKIGRIFMEFYLT